MLKHLRIQGSCTLIEWDNNLPDWSVLQAQAEQARKIALAHLQTTDTLA